MSKLKRLSGRNSSRRPVIGTLCIVSVCLVAGIFGWKDAGYSWTDSLYRAFLALGASDIYTNSHEWCLPTPSGLDCNKSELSELGYIALNIARYTGLLFLFGAVLFTLVALLSERIAQFRTHLGGRALVCIGDSDLSREAFQSTEASSLSRSWLGAPTAINQWRGVAVPWGTAQTPEQSITKATRSARQVVICAGDDVKTLNFIDAILNQAPDSQERAVQITAIFTKTGSTGEAIRHAQNKFSNSASSIRALTYSKLAVREVMKKHPPFVLAKQQGQSHVHVLIVGLGRIGRTLLDDVAVNCATQQYGKPYVTVIDPDIEKKRKWIDVEAPELNQVCQFNTISGGLGPEFEHPSPLSEDLPDITAVYICVNDGNTAIEALSNLRSWLHGQNKSVTEIFIRTNTLTLSKNHQNDDGEHVRSFGTYKAVLAESQYLSDDPDLIPRRFHEIYKDFAKSRDPESDVADWHDLAEPMKASNRALVDHLQTKIFSAGLDAQECLEPSGRVKLGCNLVLYNDDDAFEKLAALEHDRFVAERRIAGWISGERNNALKTDSNFIPYEQLSEETKSYDRSIIELSHLLLRDG